MKSKESSVLHLMAHLWDHRQEATGHSWLRMNQGLHEGLMLAVRLGLEFGEGDIGEIERRFRGGYWFGCNFESFYTCAVVYGNRSAWKAYERWTRRIPFIWKPATLKGSRGGGGQGINNPPRLTVGCEFTWNGERVKVTSFNDDKSYLIAHSYSREYREGCEVFGQSKDRETTRILHRYSIRHEDFRQAKKARVREVA